MKDADEFQHILELMADAAIAEDANCMVAIPPTQKDEWTPKKVARLQMAAVLAALGAQGFKVVRVN